MSGYKIDNRSVISAIGDIATGDLLLVGQPPVAGLIATVEYQTLPVLPGPVASQTITSYLTPASSLLATRSTS